VLRGSSVPSPTPHHHNNRYIEYESNLEALRQHRRQALLREHQAGECARVFVLVRGMLLLPLLL
jgi:hypothetical protein